MPIDSSSCLLDCSLPSSQLGVAGSNASRPGLADKADPARRHVRAGRLERHRRARACRAAAGKLGQPVVVENKPGAAARSGRAEVARAAPDGYSLLMSNTTPISLAPAMLDPPPYDPIKSFTHVSLVATVPDVDHGAPLGAGEDTCELVAWIKAQDKTVFYGSGGIGSIGHILGETFKKAARPQHRARRLQGQRADDHGPDRRAPQLLLRHAAAERAAHQIREAAAARGDLARVAH